MFDNLKESILSQNSEVNPKLVDVFYKCLIDFGDDVKYDFDNLLSEDKNRINLDDKAEELFQDLINATLNLIKYDVDEDFLINAISKDFKGSEFWEFFDGIISASIRPFEDSKLLSNMKEEKINYFFLEIMNNRILEVRDDELNTADEYTTEQINAGIRIIEFAIRLSLLKRLSVNKFSSAFCELFALSNNTAEYLWNMINRNRQELMMRMIIESTASLEDKMEELSDRLDEISDSNED